MNWIKYEPESNGNDFVAVSRWGKDHWSTFAYFETRAVDYKGIINNQHMRCDPKLHPYHAHQGSYSEKEYPTILHNKEELFNHDDWSCLDDMIMFGLVDAWFSSIHEVKIKLTEYGQEIASELRKHKSNGGSFSTFVKHTIIGDGNE